MTRPHEEALTRLEEMAMITTRALKMDGGAGSQVKFNPLAAGEDAEFKAIEIVSTPRGRGGCDYEEGACFACDEAVVTGKAPTVWTFRMSAGKN